MSEVQRTEEDQRRDENPTVELEEGFRVELQRIQSIRLLPDLPQLSNAALEAETPSQTRLSSSMDREGDGDTDSDKDRNRDRPEH